MADKSKKTVTPSRESVTCDYCGKDFEKRHLKGHTERVHEGRELCPIFLDTFCPIFNSLDTLSME